MEWLLGILPDPGTLDAILLGLFVGPVVLLGVPLVRRGVKVPRHMQIEEVPDHELAPGPAAFFREVESRLRTEGFHPVCTFEAANLPGHNVNRVYLSAGDPAVAMATALMHERDGVALGARYVEFVTEFADGTCVATRSAAATDLFDLLPGYHRFVHATVSDPLALKQLHDRHCRPLQVKEARHVEPEAFQDTLRDFYQRWVAHQEQRGLLRRLSDDAENDGATTRLAIRGIASVFNPFAEGFTITKFVLALVLGMLAPALAIAALHLPGVPIVASLAATTGVGWDVAFSIAMAPILLLGALAIGWIFNGNALLWGFLAAYGASRLLLPGGLADETARLVWLGTLTACPLVSQRIESFLARRTVR